jgi:nitroreductase
MFIDLLRKRRSIRKFTGTPLDEATIALFTETLLRSPASRGVNHREFVFVTDRELLETLSRSKRQGTEFITGAAFAIIILGNETKSDVWVEDCSIAAISAQLLAADLELGSCWGQIRNRPHDDTLSAEAYVQQLFDIPHHLRVGMIIAVGYPGETKTTVPFENLDANKIHRNRYHPER